MTGRKTLKEIRAELEAAVGLGPAGNGVVRDALRRFLTTDGDEKTPNRYMATIVKSADVERRRNSGD